MTSPEVYIGIVKRNFSFFIITRRVIIIEMRPGVHVFYVPTISKTAHYVYFAEERSHSKVAGTQHTRNGPFFWFYDGNTFTAHNNQPSPDTFKRSLPISSLNH